MIDVGLGNLRDRLAQADPGVPLYLFYVAFRIFTNHYPLLTLTEYSSISSSMYTVALHFDWIKYLEVVRFDT